MNEKEMREDSNDDDVNHNNKLIEIRRDRRKKITK